MAKFLKSAFIWCLLVIAFMALFSASKKSNRTVNKPFVDFTVQLDAEKISDVRINGDQVEYRLYGEKYTRTSYGEISEGQYEQLYSSGAKIKYGEKQSPWYYTLLINALPLLILIGIWIYFMKRMGSGGKNHFDLLKSTVRKLPDEIKVTFENVGGNAAAKDAFSDIVQYLKNPKPWKESGVRLPRGVLLEGPPGCGKTLVARALAGESNAEFFSLSASEFVEMFIGGGAARVRDTFEQASKKLPAVIFIDELDAIGRRRGSGIGASHDEREQTLNQLLVCLDGFENVDGLIVVAATNRPDVLDQALLRAGRFDRRVKIEPPDSKSREEIFKIHTKDLKLGADVKFEELAGLTEGMTGSDIESLSNEAALTALRRFGGDKLKAAERVDVLREDFLSALKPLKERESLYNKLDTVLIESASTLSEPKGEALAKITLRDGSEYEGKVVWADGTCIKLRSLDGAKSHLLSKSYVMKIEALAGTEEAEFGEQKGDIWAGKNPGTA